MKPPFLRRCWPWLVCVLVLLAGMTVCWFPARWAWPWLAERLPQVRVAQVHGSVWNGRVDGLVVRGKSLGDLHWTLGRSALWGRLHGSFALVGPQLMADGHFRRTGDGLIMLRDGHIRVPVQALGLAWPDRQAPGGELVGRIDHTLLVAGWPAQLAATTTWRHAQVIVDGQRLELGRFVMRWHPGQGAALVADLSDQGDGPLGLRGTLVVRPLGWTIEARVWPRSSRPAIRQLLERLGTVAPDGSVRIQRHAGLNRKDG